MHLISRTFFREWFCRAAGLVLPRFILQRWLSSHICSWYTKLDKVVFFHSGRSGLCETLAQIKSLEPEKHVVLAPAYICNIVHRAIRQAGLELETYPQDDFFLPDETKITDRLSRGDVAAIVLGSLFGSECAKQELTKGIRKAGPDVWLILDECQNLRPNTQVLLDSKSVLLGSFNCKTILGLMGGLVGISDNCELRIKPKRRGVGKWLQSEFLMVAYAVFQFVRKLNRDKHFSEPKCEYSECSSFPYEITSQPITKISLVWGWAGAVTLSDRQTARQQCIREIEPWFLAHDVEIIPTESFEKAPFVALRGNSQALSTLIPLKGCYGLDDNPNGSQFPRLVSFRNDGWRVKGSKLAKK